MLSVNINKERGSNLFFLSIVIRIIIKLMKQVIMITDKITIN